MTQRAVAIMVGPTAPARGGVLRVIGTGLVMGCSDRFMMTSTRSATPPSTSRHQYPHIGCSNRTSGAQAKQGCGPASGPVLDRVAGPGNTERAGGIRATSAPRATNPVRTGAAGSVAGKHFLGGGLFQFAHRLWWA